VVLRDGDVIGDDHFQMLVIVEMAAGMFKWLLEDFTKRVKENFPDE
jgi:hypothetical protein